MRKQASHEARRDPVRMLRARAARLARKGDLRKAVLTLREAAARDPSGPAFVLLAHVLTKAGKQAEAVAALKQALYHFRHEETRGRARTVARLILALDPADQSARKRAA